MSSRLTVVERVYLQKAQDAVQDLSSEPYEVELEAEEDAWRREQFVCGTRVPLDLGWVTKPAMVRILNKRRVFDRIPTDEVRQDAERRVIVLYMGGTAVMRIRPGHTARFEPTGPMEIATEHGEARAIVYAVQG